MSSQPETPQPAPLPAVIERSPELEQFRQLGRWLSLAEADDGTMQSKGAAAALRFALASMLEVNPTAALTELSFIHGRLNLSAQLVRALASKHGYRVVRAELDDQHCVAVLLDKETGQELGRTDYTIEEARSAGLIRDRSSWKTAPRRMLWARASKRVVDDFAPEVSLGITTPEDQAEIDAEPWDDGEHGAEVLQGEVVPDVPTTGTADAAPTMEPAGAAQEPGPASTETTSPPAAPAELEPDPGPFDGDPDPDTPDQLDADAELEHDLDGMDGGDLL